MRAMYGPMSGHLIGETSVFDMEAGWVPYRPFTHHFTHLKPYTDDTSETMFKINKNGDRIGDCALCFRVGAIAGGTGGTYKRLVDGFGYAVLEKIMYKYSTRDFSPVYPEEMFALVHKLAKTEENEMRKVLTRTGYSNAERDAFGTVAQDFMLEIPFYWTHKPSHTLRVNALAEEVEVIVRWNNFNKYIQTDHATTTPTVSRVAGTTRLRVRYFTMDTQERSRMVNDATNQGVTELMHSCSKLSRLVPSGTDTSTEPYQVDLSILKNATRAVHFYFVKETEANGSQAQINPFNLQEIKRWRMIQNNEVIIPWVSHLENIWYENPKAFGCLPGALIYGANMPTVLDSNDKTHITGHLPFDTLHFPTLEIEFNSALTEAWRMKVLTRDISMIQTIAGDHIQAFK